MCSHSFKVKQYGGEQSFPYKEVAFETFGITTLNFDIGFDVNLRNDRSKANYIHINGN